MHSPIEALEFAAQQSRDKASVYGVCMANSQLSGKRLDQLYALVKPGFEIVEKHMDDGTFKAKVCVFKLEGLSRLEFMISAKDDSVQSIALGTFREVSKIGAYGSMGFQTIKGNDSKPVYVIEFLNVPSRVTRADALVALATELINQIKLASL